MPRPLYKKLFYSFFSKVWIIILITMFTMVVFMSLFTKVLHHLPATNQNLSNATFRRNMKIFQCVSAYLIYVINVITNQGKIFNNFLCLNKANKLVLAYLILFRC